MSIANSTSIIGFKEDDYDTEAQFTLGVDALAGGTSYTYAKAASAIAAGGTVALTGAFGSTTTTTGTTHSATVAVPANAFAWFRLVTPAL